MRHDKQVAIRLRLEGRSYSEIREALGGVSKATLSLWLADVVMSDAARKRLNERSNEKARAAILRLAKQQTHLARQRRDAMHNAARRDIQALSPREMLLIGAALYWAEGYKRPLRRNGREITWHAVALTNADPVMCKFFIRFLMEVCEVKKEDMKIDVRIFEHQNPDVVIAFWSSTLELPPENFSKPHVTKSRSSEGKKPFDRLPYGVIQIRINNTNLFHKIMGWIGGIKEQA
ncbi:MAG TPA: DNA-binding protein [Candidatus Paceibacterota bacterium]|nr:DNA-binding protein [Candidatus Paceibacterota bacterium]